MDSYEVSDLFKPTKKMSNKDKVQSLMQLINTELSDQTELNTVLCKLMTLSSLLNETVSTIDSLISRTVSDRKLHGIKIHQIVKDEVFGNIDANYKSLINVKMKGTWKVNQINNSFIKLVKCNNKISYAKAEGRYCSELFINKPKPIMHNSNSLKLFYVFFKNNKFDITTRDSHEIIHINDIKIKVPTNFISSQDLKKTKYCKNHTVRQHCAQPNCSFYHSEFINTTNSDKDRNITFYRINEVFKEVYEHHKLIDKHPNHINNTLKDAIASSTYLFTKCMDLSKYLRHN